MQLMEIHKKSPKAPKIDREYKYLTLDPGGTTGYSIWHLQILPDGELQVDLVSADQFESTFSNLEVIMHPTEGLGPFDRVLCESYRLYAHKSSDQINSTFQTPRFIGAIEFMCWAHAYEFGTQSAAIGKQFVTDKRLKEWGLHVPGKPHRNDAVRHMASYLIFGKPIEFKLIDRNEVKQQ